MTADKRQANLALTSQVRAAEQEFIQTVAAIQGWSPADLAQKTPSSLSAEAAEKFDKERDKELLKRATKAVGLQRQARHQEVCSPAFRARQS